MKVSTPAAPCRLFLMLSLALRLRERFAEVRQSATLAVQWTREHIAWQTAQAQATRAIDDELERLAPDFASAFANDPPALRRRLLAALQRTHTRTETSATALTPQIPPALLAD